MTDIELPQTGEGTTHSTLSEARRFLDLAEWAGIRKTNRTISGKLISW